jgi:hypothetical protein
MSANNTEFAIGIIFLFLGAFLLYTEYNAGYWGVVALGLIFIVKNWSVTRKKPVSRRPDMRKGPKDDNMTNERLNQ